MEFYKYHSLGNDYLIYDCNKIKRRWIRRRLSSFAIAIMVLEQMEL